ncbi:superfamily II DNA/RNA helicase and SNF2 family-related protein [Novosphingobium sediminis]|uniref:Superfamily II DNA/RNA helicase and SNF2 family-related protein n=1 Tax=Novosphingobium sediminis TaxID=707214 RepID=A0A512AQ65_9SPHN|nr:DEAD/DEAH box helicase [Novosphingobium sediminis]GEO01848.1 superfamily II DNA/RNA helicase and SNF2 family-related protein [Novosphingobium sediminis]
METATFRAEGNLVRLYAMSAGRGPFARPQEQVVPFSDWVSTRPQQASAAVAELLKALEDEETGHDGKPLVHPAEDGCELHPDLVARFCDSEAEALGLPAATTLALELKSSGLIHRPGFRIETAWTRGSGVPVRAKILSGRLLAQGQEWRVPEPLHTALRFVEQVNASHDESERQAALAGLKAAIGDEGNTRIRSDGVIQRLRLAYASGFSLALKDTPNGPDFDPVLFNRERMLSAQDGTVLDQDRDGLLPPTIAAGFTRRFRSGNGTRTAFLLDDGSLLFIGPQLARQLEKVRQAQSGTAEQRRAFAAAPHRYLDEVLENPDDADGATPPCFVETTQFSERVAGIDIWRKPVLPWIKPKPGTWLPETFGLRIGDPPNAQSFEIPPDRVGTALAAAQQAVREDRPLFSFEGQAVPATQAAITALQGLGEIVAAARDQRGQVPRTAPENLMQRYFLQVRDNLDDVAFAPLSSASVAVEPPQSMPSAMRTTAKPHQVAGFRWLASCWLSGRPGALLADDMGLGKTFQALAFLTWLRRSEAATASGPMLIVAPSGLLANWEAEARRHLEPDALGRIVRAYGSELGRNRIGSDLDTDAGRPVIDPRAWCDAGVVLTTYETMRDYHMSFARQPFAAVLYDEAQKLKNPASQITRAAKTLNAKFQLAMTGTPVENRLQDLWSIIDVVHPGMLGSSKAFEERFPALPGKLRELHDLLSEEQDGMPPVMLRRLKSECLDSLPAKHIVTLPEPMPPAQARAYEQVVLRAMAVKGMGERGRMLEVLHALRSVSLHPVGPDHAGGHATYLDDSARLAATMKVLGEIANKGEKALVFCESLAMQAYLAAELQRHFRLAHPVARIHGAMLAKARQAAVDAFQERAPGFDVMILSTKAGGVGLTLTAANHVIHLSRWWNPAVEDQATDRVFRIGQTRDVTVYLPQAIHPDPAMGPTSFDLRLQELMERKRQLGEGLLAPGDSESDADSLFDLVITDAAFDLPAAPDPAPTPIEPEEPAHPKGIRKILGLARSMPTPAPPAVPTRPVADWPRRVVYEEGGLRDRAIFTAPIADDPIRELVIVDPYGAAGEHARRQIADFARVLIGDGQGVETVQFISFDAESVEIREFETSERQFLHMQECWKKTFGSAVDLQFTQVSRRGNRGLHDREVRATTRSGRKLIWDIGRGIAGVMTARHRCTVVLTEL